MTSLNIPLRPNSIKICTVEGCEKKYNGKGFCALHRYRVRQTGSPFKTKIDFGIGRTQEERFWSKVDKSPGQGPSGDCWIYQQSGGKYGSAGFQGKRWLAHRLAWFLTTGQIPVLYILHACDNPKCVRPSHLHEGTQQENLDEMRQRGRGLRGERNHQTKLTELQVREIKQYLAQGVARKQLAQDFAVSRSSIRDIASERTWGYIKI